MSHIIWNASPELLSIGPFSIRWYGSLFALAFYLGYRILLRAFEREKVPQLTLDSLLAHLFIATLAGARLGHCLFYEPEIYLQDPLRILKIWEGGLASHGAALGIFLVLLLFRKKNPQLSYLWLADRVAMVSPLGGALVRVGNFFNSEILGKPSDVPWAIVFARVDTQARHPAMLYEAFAYFAIAALLLHLYFKKNAGKRPGLLFGLFLIFVFGVRFAVEFFKENQAAFESSLPLNMGQALSIPMICLGIWLVQRSRRKA